MAHTSCHNNKHKKKKIRRMRSDIKQRKQRKKMQRKDKIKQARSYVKNLSKVTLSDAEILVLSKNLKFVPTPTPPRTRELIKDFDDLSRRMRKRLWAFEKKIKPKLEPFTENKQQTSNSHSGNASLENYLTATKIEIANIHCSKRFSRGEMLKKAMHNIHKNKRFKSLIRGNFNPKMQSALRKLQSNNKIVIKKSDKGNCTVVTDREQYIKEGLRQLDSGAHYMQIEEDVTENVSHLVHETLLQLLSKREITEKNLKYLSPLIGTKTKTAKLYLLNKVHSDPPTKARPIISANNCPVERISEYVNFFLQPFVTEQHTYIMDTSDFIRTVESRTIPT